MNIRHRQFVPVFALAIFALAIAMGVASLCQAQTARTARPGQLPSFAAVEAAVAAHFAKLRDREAGDLISKGDVKPVFKLLEQLGWVVEDQKEILSLVLDDQDTLVRTLRSSRGVKFMRQVSNDKLIYDRLDRVVRESGGRRMLEDLVKLPDGARYAKADRTRAVPGMLDLLPKKGNGRTRQIRDYNKPTGKIYTASGLVDRFEESYRKALKI